MKFLSQLFPVDALRETVMRFPASAVCSVGLFVALLLGVHEVIDLNVHGEMYARTLGFLVCGFFWFGFLRLLRDAMAWSGAREFLIGALGALVLAAAVYFQSGFEIAFFVAMIVPALLLGISFAPYLRSKDDLSFWFYNRQVWLGAALSILAGVIWGAGISAALAAIDYLFGVNVIRRVFSDVWAFSMVVFAPLYALSWVPSTFSYREEDCHAPPQLAFMINWVLAPLVVVYMLILYAYFIKIAIVGELPRGQLSYMITAFGGIGVLTYLAGWPLRENGGPFLKPIYKFFFPALIIPVVMQAVSIYMRIDQYGVTEQRYLVVLSTVWMAVLAVAFTFRKPALKFVVGVLSVMLLFTAIGPFSAPSIAERSQLSRLETLLLNAGVLVDGQIVETEKDVSFEERQSISSVVSFLRNRDKGEVLRPWVADLDAEDDVPHAHALVQLMGFEYTSKYQREQTAQSDFINLNGMRDQDLVVDVRGYSYLLDGGYVFDNPKKDKPWRKEWLIEAVSLNAEYEDGIMRFTEGGGRSVEFDVMAYAASQIEANPSHDARELFLEAEVNGLRVRVNFLNIHVRNGEDGQPRVPNFSFRALVDY